MSLLPSKKKEKRTEVDLILNHWTPMLSQIKSKPQPLLVNWVAVCVVCVCWANANHENNPEIPLECLHVCLQERVRESAWYNFPNAHPALIGRNTINLHHGYNNANRQITFPHLWSKQKAWSTAPSSFHVTRRVQNLTFSEYPSSENE